MRLLITGAHFTPAQAVIEELQKGENHQIIYVGRKTTMEGDKSPSVESQILPNLGVQFIPIIAGRVRRFISFGTFISLLKIPIGFIQGFWIILTKQPDIVVSFGGYVAVPLVFWAWVFNIPILIHEQTLVSGLANSVSAIFATKIAVTFDKKYPFKKEKILITGNPIRRAILAKINKPGLEVQKFLGQQKKSKLPLLFITGGNQGAHIFNQAVSEKIDELTEKYLVVHQTGDSKYKDYDGLLELSKTIKRSNNYYLAKFIPEEDISVILKNADLVVTRAGANTLLELASLGVPSIIVPIPYLTRNEQVKNARFFADAGLGEIIYQNEFTTDKFMEQVAQMMKNREKMKQNAIKASAVVIPNAAQKLTQEILLMTRNV